MLRKTLAAALAASFAFAPVTLRAEEHDHVVNAGKIRIVHPWVRAGDAGQNTLAFMEVINDGETDTLESVATDAASSARIVGVTMKDGVSALQDVGATEIPAGDFDFDPAGLAIELVGLKQAIEKGGEIELELTFKAAGTVHLHAEVEASDATQHSHAGHAH